MKTFPNNWNPEKDPIIQDLKKRVNDKIISLSKFFKNDEFKKLSPGIRKSLENTFYLLNECNQEFFIFEEASYNHSVRAITLEACQTTLFYLREELSKYKSAEKLIFSQEKEELIKIIVSNFDKLILNK